MTDLQRMRGSFGGLPPVLRIEQGWFGRWKLLHITNGRTEVLARSRDVTMLQYLEALYRGHQRLELTDAVIPTDDPWSYIANALNLASDLIYEHNVAVGWWADGNIPTKLCLIHSEISEAMEGHRKDLMDKHLPDVPMVEVELADAMIRELDVSRHLNSNIGATFVRKIAYNKTRADHRRENREKAGGKAY